MPSFKRLRENLSKLLAALLLTLLVLSFAVWGVGDLFSGRSSRAVAKVGSQTISNIELEQAVEQQIRRFAAMFGQEPDREQLKKMGLERQILESLVSRKLLVLEGGRLGLAASDAHIIGQLRQDERFMGEDGAFDKRKFETFLYHAGESEKSFVKELKEDAVITALADAVSAAPEVPAVLSGPMQRHLGERRTANLLVLPAGHIKDVPEPSESELSGYYEQEKEKFSAPELRTASYLTLGLDDVKGDIDTGDAALKEAYEAHAGSFSTPENRVLRQILVPSKETADKAYAAINGGMDFQKAARDIAGLQDEQTEFGFVTKGELSAGGILPLEADEKVFALKKAETAAPVESSMGWHIFKVVNIIPAKNSTFEEVKEDLKKGLQAEKGAQLISELAAKIEDMLGGGASLEEVAEKLHLAKAKNAGPLSQEGKGQGGEVTPGLPDHPDFLATVFATGEGSPSSVALSPDGLSAFVLRVDSVRPARARALDEVRGLAAKSWKENKRQEILYALAQETAEKLKSSGGTLADAARDLGIAVTPSGQLYRDGKTQEAAPPELVAALFAMPEGGRGKTTGAYERKDGAYVIAELSQVLPADPEDKTHGLTVVTQTLREQAREDLLHQYMTYLHYRHHVEYEGD